MGKLHGEPSMPPSVPAGFVTLFRDHKVDDMVRDYAVQHMRPVYERVCREYPEGARSAEAEMIRQAWTEALEDSAPSIPASALLAMTALVAEHPEIGTNQLAEAARRLSFGQQGSLASQMVAVGVCGRLGLSDVLPRALTLAEGEYPVPLRAAAISAVGALGGRDEIARLEAVRVSDTGKRLQAALDTAIRRLEVKAGVLVLGKKEG